MPRKAHALLLFLTSSLLVTLAQTQQMYELPQANDSIAVPFFNPKAALEGGLRAAAVNNDTAVQTQEVLSVLLSFTNTSAMSSGTHVADCPCDDGATESTPQHPSSALRAGALRGEGLAEAPGDAALLEHS